MKLLSILALVAAALGAIVAIGSFPVESSYSGKAQLVQRVRKDAADDLFESSGSPVGSPQLLIIEDPKAFTGEKSPEGAAFVDEGYLEMNKIYPLQMKTVSYVAGLARLGGGAVLVVGLVVGWWSRRRYRNIGTTHPTATRA